MRRCVCAAIAVLIGSALFGPAAAAAGTPLTICNTNPNGVPHFPLYVAVGYYSAGVNDAADAKVLTGPFVSVGWSAINQGACATFANPFGARYMFWFAFDNGYVNSNKAGTWSTNGVRAFCITNPWRPGAGPAAAFTLEEENTSQSQCEPPRPANDLEPVWFDSPRIWVPARMVDLAVGATVRFDASNDGDQR